MLGTIIAGVVTYWSTAIDLLIILMLFFAKGQPPLTKVSGL